MVDTPKILIVDDEKDVCELVGAVLESEGFWVTAACRGDEAIRHLEKDGYQILMVDMRLEGKISGIDIITHCRNFSKKPKIVVMSATSKALLNPILEQEGISDLVDGVFEKPSDLHQDILVKKIKTILAKG